MLHDNREYIVCLGKRGIIDLFMSSGQFRIENVTSWARTLYLTASDKFFIYVKDDAIILSENGGVGIMAAICTIELLNETEKRTKLAVSFKTGTINLKLLLYLCLLLFAFSLILISISVPASVIPFFISLIVFFIWLSKWILVKSIRLKIEKIIAEYMVLPL